MLKKLCIIKISLILLDKHKYPRGFGTTGLGFALRAVESEGTLDQSNSSSEVTNGLTKSEATDGVSVQEFRLTLLSVYERRHRVNASKGTGYIRARLTAEKTN